MMDQQLHLNILEWMEEAAENLRQSLQKVLQVEEKTNAADLVTEMDKATEAYFVEKIRHHYPAHRMTGEEGLADPIKDTKGTIWVLDPIDGTLNFVKQKNHFGIMLGIFQDGQPLAGYIYDVMNHDLYYGLVGQGAFLNHEPLKPIPVTRIEESLVCANVGMCVRNLCNVMQVVDRALGVRTYGAAAISIISVIRGENAVYLSSNLNPWDFGAGWAICQAMGFKASQPNGESLDILTKTPVVFAHPNVYNEVVELIATSREIGEINEHA
ncbi:inositol monophosphatase family protein [Vaginisenegalia massiliensis]|uniref:inositol monophosphatase family protein n=1 Tax=Vaginisenegalia massiliensis TaxID=2058294 RepID=UPI001F14D1CF|nr:inositol monophosphatase family protein [Vaginisenegalia massiliensis]